MVRVRHDTGYFSYPIEGGTLEVTRASGVTQATLEAGKVYYRNGGDTHVTKNVDDHRCHEVLVELKDQPSPLKGETPCNCVTCSPPPRSP